MAVKIGGRVPDAALLLTGGTETTLAAFRDRWLVLYFYPKAGTPGCTQEGLDFSAAIARFRRQSARILGVSRDSLSAQQRFKDKQNFAFDLVADVDEALCRQFDVIKMKNMYGKKVRGIERSTFLVDPEGVLRREWRGVRVKGHAEEVLDAIKELNN